MVVNDKPLGIKRRSAGYRNKKLSAGDSYGFIRMDSFERGSEGGDEGKRPGAEKADSPRLILAHRGAGARQSAHLSVGRDR